MAANFCFFAGVFPADEAPRPLYDRGFRPQEDISRSGAAADRATAVQADRSKRNARNALDRVRVRDALLQRDSYAGAVRDGTAATVAAVESTEIGRRGHGSGVQHGGVINN